MNALLTKLRGFFKRRRVRCLLAILLAVLLAFFLLKPHGVETYLIMGMDNYGSLETVGRSDVIMLVSLNHDANRITTVAFPRDLAVVRTSGREAKINTIVRINGEEELVATLEQEFGVPISGWFRVNFTSLIDIVDAIGGCDVTLTQAEANYLDKTAGRYPDHPLSEGLCHLNGAQALYYARCRSLDSDFERNNRQSRLISAMVKSAGRVGFTRAGALLDSLSGAWRSSLSGAQQASLLVRALFLVRAKVVSLTIPLDDHYWYAKAKNGDNCVYINTENNAALLKKAL